MKRTAALLLVSAAVAVGAGTASADEPSAPPQYGPEWSPATPGPEWDPEPDTPFQPGYAPGTADLVDDTLGPVVSRLLGGLLG